MFLILSLFQFLAVVHKNGQWLGQVIGTAPYPLQPVGC